MHVTRLDLPPTYELPGHDPMRMLRLQDASLVPPTSSGSDFPTRFRIAERREHWSDNACPLISSSPFSLVRRLTRRSWRVPDGLIGLAEVITRNFQSS